MIVWAFCAVAAGKSATIVYINGAKYYIHTVQAGETLYGLSKTYGVGEKVILENNPSIARGLKTAENIKIPFVADVPEPKSDKKLRKTFDFHFVSKGETLYAISRQYEIPVKTLLEDNPNLDPLHMRLGERILIRRKQIGSEDEAGTKEQWEEYRQSLNSVAEEGTAYHIVHPGETFYSLSRRFGITEAEFSALNGGLKPADLKAGAMIKIPQPDGAVTAEVADSLRRDSVAASERQVVPVEFRALRRSEPLRVALLLPIATGGEANGNYLEFYQGFLLGLDSVKIRQGISAEVHLYNTARDTARIREIVCEIRQKVAEKGEQLSPWLEQEEEWRSIKERGILRTEDAYSFKTIADICQKCFGKDANYRIQRSFFHVADDRMLWCPKLAIELPDGSKVAQSRGWINELSADWNVIIEHNDSGATPVKHPDQPRYTFAKSKDERGEDAYRFIGIFEWSETTPSGEHIYKRMASDMKLK